MRADVHFVERLNADAVVLSYRGPFSRYAHDGE